VTNAERKRDIFVPATGDGVDIGCADTTGVNSDVYVMFLEFLQRKLTPYELKYTKYVDYESSPLCV
jgi:hypothetical protein